MLTLSELLRPGLTGAKRSAGARAEFDEQCTDVIRAWKKTCHEYARSCRGRVGQYKPNGTGRNFHAIEIATNNVNTSVQIRLHSILPFVAARKFRSPSAKCPYVDLPELTTQNELILLPAELLNSQLVLEDWMREKLDPASWADALYWRPETVGELVFISFD